MLRIAIRRKAPPDGIIFHLGDFAYGGHAVWNDRLSQLHGRMYLILGNHDFKNIEKGFLSWFEAVTQQICIQVGGQTIVLNHNPFLCYARADHTETYGNSLGTFIPAPCPNPGRTSLASECSSRDSTM